MPIRLGITNSIDVGIKFAGQFEKQIPFATKDALNQVGFDLRRKLLADTKRLLDNPVPYIFNAWRVIKADLKNLRYVVHIEDVDRQPYYEQVIFGGYGVDTQLDQSLKRQEKINKRQSSSPSPYYKRTRYGNVSGGNYQKTYGLIRKGYASYLPKKGSRREGIYQFKSNSGKDLKALRPLFFTPSKRKGRVVFPLERLSEPIVNTYNKIFVKIYNKKLDIVRTRLLQGKS